MYELLLLSVVVAGGYWGQWFVRKKPHGTATFGQMQLAAGAMALAGVWARHGGPEAFGVVGAIGLGMGGVLLVVGPLVRSAARRMAASDHLKISKRLFDVAELLNPGSGVGEEKALLGAMTEIREGKVDQTIEALSQARDRAPVDARRAIDERIAMLYLAAYRWEDAIAHAEGHLMELPALEVRSDTPDQQPTLREALGLAPPVWVELLGAYGRVGNLDRAAAMLAQLEVACEGRPDAGVWIHRARMMFLALAGRPTAVRALVAPAKARHMSIAARSYWLAVAYEHGGEREAATAAYAKARSKSRGKPREMIDRAVAGLAARTATQLSATASEAVALAEARPIPETPAIDRPPMIWASPLLVASILVAAAVISFVFGPTGDVGTLVRAGAIVRGFVDAGEWWRVVASVLIHIGAIHLVVNAIGLWFIGRLCEDMYGGARTVAIFALAGVAGQTASYLASPAGISAGASGAIFGMLGALFVELAIHRKHYRAAWKRGMFGSLAIVTIAQLAIDFMYPIVDQWSHGGGLFAGALCGLVLSPRWKWARFSLYAARSLAIVFGLATAYAVAMIAQTDVEASLSREARVPRRVGDVIASVPPSWQTIADVVMDPDTLVQIRIRRVDSDPMALATWIGQAPVALASEGLQSEGVVPQEARTVTLPAGWEGTEVKVSYTDSMDAKQELRLVVAGRVFGGTTILASVNIPAGLADDVAPFIAQTLASLTPAD